MARRFCIALLLASATATADGPVRDCPCRAQDGQSRPQGTVACITITGTPWLVQCTMSQNTPYWRRLNDASGCPTA